MYVRICMHACALYENVYIYIYTYIHVYNHIYKNIHDRMSTYVHMYRCIRIYMHNWTHVCIYIYIHVRHAISCIQIPYTILNITYVSRQPVHITSSESSCLDTADMWWETSGSTTERCVDESSDSLSMV